MLTIEALNEYGADTKEGVARCMGMEDFYLQLIATQLEDAGFSRFEEAIDSGDMTKAFDAAHALKGALANLALTPIAEPVSEITERLRNATGPVDVSDIMPKYKDALERLREIAG